MSENIFEIARRIRDCAIRGEAWTDVDLARLAAEASSDEGSSALFGILAEGLSDLFEPRLVDAYARIFSEVIAAALPQYRAEELRARYGRVRRPRRIEGNPRIVYVLSRVTLGADVAITSVMLDAARRRFPEARIVLAGSEKSYALFAADPRIDHLPVSYVRRGALRDRLAACPRFDELDSIVIDPDSRLTQLGLMPVCPEENYYFFESRSYGGDTDESLGILARRWAAEVFGIADARAFICAGEEPGIAADVAVSFGVGENPAKGMPHPFEQQLLAALAGRGLRIVVDSGPGGEEEERVRRAAGACGDSVRIFRGSFAAFAGIIAASRLYIGYDSAGQHAAAACGTPLITVFAGAPCPRFTARWRPTGSGPMEIIRVENRDPAGVLARTLEVVDRLLG
ncbi:MAG: glycosyltransferase family 9 protein [Rhodospirillales bacterium]